MNIANSNVTIVSDRVGAQVRALVEQFKISDQSIARLRERKRKNALRLKRSHHRFAAKEHRQQHCASRNATLASPRHTEAVKNTSPTPTIFRKGEKIISRKKAPPRLRVGERVLARKYTSSSPPLSPCSSPSERLKVKAATSAEQSNPTKVSATNSERRRRSPKFQVGERINAIKQLPSPSPQKPTSEYTKTERERPFEVGEHVVALAKQALSSPPLCETEEKDTDRVDSPFSDPMTKEFDLDALISRAKDITKLSNDHSLRVDNYFEATPRGGNITQYSTACAEDFGEMLHQVRGMALEDMKELQGHYR